MPGTKRQVQENLLGLLKELNSVCDTLEIDYEDDFDIEELQKSLETQTSEGDSDGH